MKRLIKYLSSKTNFSTFLHINYSNFRLKLCQKPIRVTKIVKRIKSEEVWEKLEEENYLNRQPFTKYFRQTLVFM